VCWPPANASTENRLKGAPALRRGSPVGVFREGVTHHGAVEQSPPERAEPFALTLKLFNTVADECLPVVLEHGVSVRAARLAELLETNPAALAGAAMFFNGRALARADVIAALRGLPGDIAVRADTGAAKPVTPELAALADIAEAAGRAIMEVRAHGYSVEYKADQSPLTQADLASNAIIARALAERFPGVPVLSEEGADIACETRAAWKRLFIVDPLDGTKEFVKELGEFCVCIALAENGFPAYGAVHVPVWGKTYVGGLGLGAHRRETGKAWEAIAVRPPETIGAEGYAVLASRSHPDPGIEAWLADKPVRQRVTAGSALKFCLVAEGAADLYPRFNPTHEWDTAAGQAVLEGAGGSVVRFADGIPGERLPVNKPDLFNGPFLASARPLK